MQEMIAHELEMIAERVLSIAETEQPPTVTTPIIRDIWAGGPPGNYHRTLGLLSYEQLIYWHPWLMANVKERLLREGAITTLSNLLQRNPGITARLETRPPQPPGIGLQSVKLDFENPDEWTYDSLVYPLLARAFYLQTKPPQHIGQIVRNCFVAWLNGLLIPFGMALLHGFIGERDFHLSLDEEIRIRPIEDSDIQSLLYSIHPTMAQWVPFDFGSATHVVEFRPRDETDPLVDRYDRGITRVLTALRLLRESSVSAVSVPLATLMTDTPSIMRGAVAAPDYRTRFIPQADPLGDKEIVLSELEKLYNALGKHGGEYPLRTVLRWWDLSLGQWNLMDRLLAAWIALETFYGQGMEQDHGELRFRLSLRGALYLHNNSSKSFKTWYSDLKQSYLSRCKIVHAGRGDPKKKIDEMVRHQEIASEALHRTIRRALLNPPKWSIANAETVLADCIE